VKSKLKTTRNVRFMGFSSKFCGQVCS